MLSRWLFYPLILKEKFSPLNWDPLKWCIEIHSNISSWSRVQWSYCMLKRNNGPGWRSLSALKGPGDIEPNSISQVFVGRKTERGSPISLSLARCISDTIKTEAGNFWGKWSNAIFSIWLKFTNFYISWKIKFGIRKRVLSVFSKITVCSTKLNCFDWAVLFIFNKAYTSSTKQDGRSWKIWAGQKIIRL